MVFTEDDDAETDSDGDDADERDAEQLLLDHSEPRAIPHAQIPSHVATSALRHVQDVQVAVLQRNRSPTPPRVLVKSTTGGGIAFTEHDIQFLIKYLAFKRSQDENLDMVQFWKDVAEKAPHHSRQSWMKFWRRHKHELEQTGTIQPHDPSVNQGKRARYGHHDNVLLAKYLATNPPGTLDAIFQEFARQHTHHVWKGWQEHYRLHKAAIDELIEHLEKGEDIDTDVVVTT